jgi:hypothetical protein
VARDLRPASGRRTAQEGNHIHEGGAEEHSSAEQLDDVNRAHRVEAVPAQQVEKADKSEYHENDRDSP